MQPAPCILQDVYSFSTALSALAVAGQWQLALGFLERMMEAQVFKDCGERFSVHSQFLDVLGNSVLTQRSRQARQPHDPFCRVSWPSSDHHEGMYILVECGAAGLQFKHYA